MDATSDGFDMGGSDAASAFASGGDMGDASAFSPDLSMDMRKRMMEAHLTDRNKGSFEWERGPRAGASRDLIQKKNDRTLTDKSKTWGGKEADKVADSGESGGRFKDWSAGATVFSKGVGGHKSAWSKGGSTELAGGVKVDGEVHAGKVWGAAMADAAVDLKSGAVTATATAAGEVRAIGVEGSASKKFGDDSKASVEAKAWGKAYVGVSAKGTAAVHVDVKNKTAMASVGGEAFAGAKATAILRPSVKIAGEDISQFSGVTAEAYAGVGVKAKAEAGIENGRLKAKVELGAALGVGVGVGVNIDVNLVGVKNVAVKGYNAAKEKAGEVYNDVSQKARDVGSSLQQKLSVGTEQLKQAWGRFGFGS
jgi:hypothetical protein